jgi:hypothetical protein
MPLVCPACGHAALGVSAALELGSDARSDEITLQIAECSSCRFSGIAVYEESRRGGFDSESVDHRAYRAPPESVAALKERLAGCPRPRDPRCRCAAHKALGRRNAQGRWAGLRDYELGPPMPVRYRRD